MVMSAQCVPVRCELSPETNVPPEDEGDGNDEIPELWEGSDNKVKGGEQGGA